MFLSKENWMGCLSRRVFLRVVCDLSDVHWLKKFINPTGVKRMQSVTSHTNTKCSIMYLVDFQQKFLFSPSGKFWTKRWDMRVMRRRISNKEWKCKKMGDRGKPNPLPLKNVLTRRAINYREGQPSIWHILSSVVRSHLHSKFLYGVQSYPDYYLKWIYTKRFSLSDLVSLKKYLWPLVHSSL